MAPQSRERDFDNIGGLKNHIQVLKEMIIYPLLYREVFDSYGIEPPKGVLFHGPPGTGKTLTAGAVAAECSKSSNRRVSFYMRKGADCLNKYVGESEKRLQNLFSQAHNTRPSIIFFDEIDGLVPTRSESQEAHASVVSTLLALMDGLDSKSEVFVIGATNRIDMIDPALRRPGRFDRELYFPLPPLESRVQIFQIHTRNWKHRPSPSLLHRLASECAGYCGADIQSLCTQAVMKSLHRNFPQIADTRKRYPINLRNIQVEETDFWDAKESMVPVSQRSYILPSRPLTPELEPLLRHCLDMSLDHIYKACPFKFMFYNREDYSKNKSLSCPRFLLIANEGHAVVSHIAPAVLHCFDHLPVTLIDLTSLKEYNNRNIIHKLEEARQSMPSILYFRDMSSWWNLVDEAARQLLVTSVEALDSCSVAQIFLFGTIYSPSYEDLPPDVKKLFPKSKSFLVPEPSKEERILFFNQLLLKKNTSPPKMKQGTLSFGDAQYDTLSELDFDPDQKRRRSLRQRGLDVEYLGLNSLCKPRSGSYYRKYVHPGQNGNTIRNLRNKCSRLLPFDDLDIPVRKKFKMASESDAAGSSKASVFAFSTTPAAPQNIPDSVKIDVNRLEELVTRAVEITSICHVTSIIRLYEELEIVTLRYTARWDRSTLPEELDREISVFVQT